MEWIALYKKIIFLTILLLIISNVFSTNYDKNIVPASNNWSYTVNWSVTGNDVEHTATGSGTQYASYDDLLILPSDWFVEYNFKRATSDNDAQQFRLTNPAGDQYYAIRVMNPVGAGYELDLAYWNTSDWIVLFADGNTYDNATSYVIEVGRLEDKYYLKVNGNTINAVTSTYHDVNKIYILDNSNSDSGVTLYHDINYGTFTVSPPIYGITTDFNYVLDEDNSQIDFYDATTDTNADAHVVLDDWNWFINGTKISDDQNFAYNTQANQDLNVCLGSSGIFDGNRYTDFYCNPNVYSWDTITPTIDVNIDTDAFGFVTDFGVDYNMACYDNFTPIQYDVNYTYNGTTTNIYSSSDANASIHSGSLDLNIGQSVYLTFTCTDSYGNFVTTDSNQFYALQFYLIDEDTGEYFDLNNVVTARAFTYDGTHEYDFKDTNTVTKNFFSDSQVVQFEFVYDDLSQTRIHRDIDFRYAPDENIPVCVAEPQTFYEQRFLSKSTQAVLLKNTFANCYNMIATTKDLYGTKLMARAFTVNKPYTYASTAGTTIAYIDGSKESEIDLDVLRYNTTTYELDILGTSIGFAPVFNSTTGEYDANVVRWFYQDLSGVSTRTTLGVYKNNVLLWSYTETSDPNEFQTTMYYGDLNLTVDDFLVIKVTKTTTEGSVTVERTFTLSGTQFSGVINEVVAVVLAMILLVFGLTITSYKQTFGWFGLLIEGMALIILALAPWYWYIQFLIGITIILMVFTALVAKQETGGII